jgi:hypothetical protein
MDEFEARLRAFRPRRPGPLPAPSKARPVLWILGGAAAAAIAMFAVRDFGAARRVLPVPDPRVLHGPTVGALTALALSDPAALDAELTRLSQTLLPDVKQPNRALSALGR